MFCPACGAANQDDARFCTSCGRPLPVAAPPQPAAAASEPAAVGPENTPTSDAPAGTAGTVTPPPEGGPRYAYQPYPTSPPPSPFGAPPFGAPHPYGGDAWAAPNPGDSLAPFGAPLARWWQRVGSMCIDVLILAVPSLILNGVVIAVFGTTHPRVIDGQSVNVRSSGGAGLILSAVLIILEALYFACFNGQGTGQTVGNRAPGIAVRDVETGEAIGLGRGLLRWLVRFALYLALIIPGLVNDLFPLWDARRQTIADKAARSVVIRLR